MNRWSNSLLWIGVAVLCQACAGTMPATPGAPTEGAMRVYRDPATGAFKAPSPGAANALSTDARASSSGKDLVESAGASAGGGIRLDLQGKFRSYAIATKDDQGNVSVRCEPGTPKQP